MTYLKATQDPIQSIKYSTTRNKSHKQKQQTPTHAHAKHIFIFAQAYCKTLKNTQAKIKKSLSSPLLPALKNSANIQRTELLAAYNSTLVKWRGSGQICKSQFHS